MNTQYTLLNKPYIHILEIGTGGCHSYSILPCSRWDACLTLLRGARGLPPCLGKTHKADDLLLGTGSHERELSTWKVVVPGMALVACTYWDAANTFLTINGSLKRFVFGNTGFNGARAEPRRDSVTSVCRNLSSQIANRQKSMHMHLLNRSQGRNNIKIGFRRTNIYIAATTRKALYELASSHSSIQSLYTSIS